MQTVHQLLTNSTNRLSFTPCLNNSLPTPTTSQQQASLPTQTPTNSIDVLLTRSRILQIQLKQAKQQQHMMIELIQSIMKVEQGEGRQLKKSNRRCRRDIVEWHHCPYASCSRQYSTQTSLQRHLKVKHTVMKVEPPQLYDDLQPAPNLTAQSNIDEEVEQIENT